MGILDRFRNRTTDPASTLGTDDTLPATTDGMSSRIGASGRDLASKATQYYKENPKLVGGIALVASALLLNRMRGTPK
jgi:hypothetical protein